MLISNENRRMISLRFPEPRQRPQSVGGNRADAAEFTSTAQVVSSPPPVAERKSARKRSARTTNSTYRTRPKPPPSRKRRDADEEAAMAPHTSTESFEVPADESHFPINRSNSATAAALLNMSNDTRLAATGSSLMEAAPTIDAGGDYVGYDTGLSFLEGMPPEHGFGYAEPPPPPPAPRPPHLNEVSIGGAAPRPGLSILPPPSHDELVASGRDAFPDPSPAACGKRKLAEIAAAQMLAGVNAATAARGAEARSHAAAGGSGRGRPGPGAAAADPMATAAAVEAAAAAHRQVLPAQAEEVVVPLAPPAASVPNPLGGLGGGLRIANPDSFGVSNKRRFLNGQASPSTPWDGQMEALVSQVKSSQEAAASASQEGKADSGDGAAATANGAAGVKADPAGVASDGPEGGGSVASLPEPNPLPLPLRNPRSALQAAVCGGSLPDVTRACAGAARGSPGLHEVNERDGAGYHPLHSAAALGMLENGGGGGGSGENGAASSAAGICDTLISGGADVMCRDPNGNTPVHWAARSGSSDLVGLLLSRSCPLDAQNDAGETALHWAMRAGRRGEGAARALVESGARVNVFNRASRRPLDVASEGFGSVENGGPGSGNGSADNVKVDASDRRSARWNLMEASPQCRTLVLHHEECLGHLAKDEEAWEAPERIKSIMSAMGAPATSSGAPSDDGDAGRFKPCEVTVSSDFERATLELLSRVHSAEYLSFINDLSKDLERKRKLELAGQGSAEKPAAEGSAEDKAEGEGGATSAAAPAKAPTVLPFTPMVQRKIMPQAKPREDGHSDTAFSAGSLKAARRAAGAVQHAVDW